MGGEDREALSRASRGKDATRLTGSGIERRRLCVLRRTTATSFEETGHRGLGFRGRVFAAASTRRTEHSNSSYPPRPKLHPTVKRVPVENVLPGAHFAAKLTPHPQLPSELGLLEMANELLIISST